jgi:protein-S-isoprenylcysteine O-methyltransferase Ste14
MSIVGYLGMAGGLVALVATKSLLSPSPFVILAQSLAVALMVWARITFGRRSFHAAADPTSGGLVTTGPYRWIRHPIYAAVCGFTWVSIIPHWGWRSGLLGGLVLVSALVRILGEEALVTKKYPEYRDYSARTWRLVPYLF